MSDRYNSYDVRTWPGFRPLIIAHDVGHSRDRSTALIGGNSPYHPRLLGISEMIEFPNGLFGSARASALAEIDGRYHGNAIIVADLSFDPTYAEMLVDAFGPRVIGIHTTRHGDGASFERRPVGNRVISVYIVGRSFLLELFHSVLQSDEVRMIDSPMSRKTYQQLVGLEIEFRHTGTVYKCPAGQHDDLAMPCAMLAWAARHPHVPGWYQDGMLDRRPRIRRPRSDDPWKAFT